MVFFAAYSVMPFRLKSAPQWRQAVVWCWPLKNEFSPLHLAHIMCTSLSPHFRQMWSDSIIMDVSELPQILHFGVEKMWVFPQKHLAIGPDPARTRPIKSECLLEQGVEGRT